MKKKKNAWAIGLSVSSNSEITVRVPFLGRELELCPKCKKGKMVTYAITDSTWVSGGLKRSLNCCSIPVAKPDWQARLCPKGSWKKLNEKIWTMIAYPTSLKYHKLPVCWSTPTIRIPIAWQAIYPDASSNWVLQTICPTPKSQPRLQRPTFYLFSQWSYLGQTVYKTLDCCASLETKNNYAKC